MLIELNITEMSWNIYNQILAYRLIKFLQGFTKTFFSEQYVRNSVDTHMHWSTANQAMMWDRRYEWSCWMSEKLLFWRTDVNSKSCYCTLGRLLMFIGLWHHSTYCTTVRTILSHLHVLYTVRTIHTAHCTYSTCSLFPCFRC